MRRSGMLLPVASLPSKYGIGTFSKEAYDFVDMLHSAGQKLWQILPLGPTGYGDSPYQSFSTFAGNPYFIDLDQLVGEGLLTEEECNSYDWGNKSNYIDYEKIYLSRFKILRKAYKRSNIGDSKKFNAYCKKNSWWLDDYALYMSIKDSYDGKPWIEWDEEIRERKEDALLSYKRDLEEEIEFYKYLQYLFSQQWHKLKAYANKKGISIIGDIPIYVSLDSSDTWANPELFQLDKECLPTAVAGCPPDSFCETGQLWGNPLYDWEYHQFTDYEWWIKRIKYSFNLYDIVRIDHFRGFDEYYSIPYGDTTAKGGHWEKGPGLAFFEMLKGWFGNLDIIAEDLGTLTDSVVQLVRDTGFPGMRILQFAFDESRSSSYLPYKCDKNCVVYTGTHDNNTTIGWYKEESDQIKAYVASYLGVENEPISVTKALIRQALSSTADTAIIPLQDYLLLDEKSRTNIPGTVGGNWSFRVTKDQLKELDLAWMKELTDLYGR